MADPVDDRVDVFISHAGPDWEIAEWVEWALRDQLKLTTILDSYDFAVGDNFILKMNDALRRADRVVLLVSPASVDRRFVEDEWSAALTGERGRLIPILVAPTDDIPPLLRPILRANLIDKTRDQVLAELSRTFNGKERPTSEPPFPQAAPPAVGPPPPVVETAAEATIQGLRANAIWIPPGAVTLGVAADEEASLADLVSVADLRYQGPQHEVEVAGFYLARFTTTNKEYWRFVGNVEYAVPYGGGSLGASAAWDPKARIYPPGLDDHPVVAISWHDAVAYSRWVGGRLPTEAEWERAARGPDTRRWPFGDDWRPEAANTSESDRRGTVVVGSLSPVGDGPFGAADQAGNVWEWCSTVLRPYPYAPQDGRELETADGRRAIRGGDWASDRWTATVSMRRGAPATDRGATIGFRVAFDGPPPA